MSWRKHPDHKSETRAVKTALEAAGIRGVKVGHGTGTAWSWLEIRATLPPIEHLSYPDQFQRMVCAGNCPCRARRDDVLRRIYAIVRDVTGRHGDYNGDTMVDLRENA